MEINIFTVSAKLNSLSHETIGGIVSKETVRCIGGKVKH